MCVSEYVKGEIRSRCDSELGVGQGRKKRCLLFDVEGGTGYTMNSNTL